MDRLLVLRLLGGGEEPAPYGRFRELQQQLLRLSPVQQQQLLQYTVDTLQHRTSKATAAADPFLAQKCARLCTLLLREGPPAFKPMLQRLNPNPLRTLETFRAPPHPVLGEAPVAAVRSEAATALSLLFSCDEEGGSSSCSSPYGHTYSSISTGSSSGNYGNSSSSSYGGSSGYSSSKLTAIENPSCLSLHQQQQHQQQMSALAASEQALKIVADAAAKYLPTALQRRLPALGPPYLTSSSSSSSSSGQGAYVAAAHAQRGYGSSSGYCSYPGVQPSEMQQQQQQQQHIRGPWGPSVPNRYTSPSVGIVPAAAPPNNSSSNSNSNSSSSSSSSPGVYEARVVEEFAAVAGVRLKPTPAALSDFAQRAAAMEPLLLCCLLQQQLTADEDKWASKLRLLHGIKAVVQHEAQQQQQGVGRCSFKEAAAANLLQQIEACTKTPQLQSIANEVLSLLSGSADAAAAAPVTAAAAAAAVAAAAPAAAAASEPTDLLMLDSSEAAAPPAAAAPASGSLLEDLLDVQPAAATAASAATAAPAATAAAKPAAVPARQTVNQADTLDLLLGGGAPASTEPPTALFSGLRLKSSDSAGSAEAATASGVPAAAAAAGRPAAAGSRAAATTLSPFPFAAGASPPAPQQQQLLQQLQQQPQQQQQSLLSPPQTSASGASQSAAPAAAAAGAAATSLLEVDLLDVAAGTSATQQQQQQQQQQSSLLDVSAVSVMPQPQQLQQQQLQQQQHQPTGYAALLPSQQQQQQVSGYAALLQPQQQRPAAKAFPFVAAAAAADPLQQSSKAAVVSAARTPNSGSALFSLTAK